MLSEQVTGRMPKRVISAPVNLRFLLSCKNPLRRNSPKGARDIAREVQLD